MADLDAERPSIGPELADFHPDRASIGAKLADIGAINQRRALLLGAGLVALTTPALAQLAGETATWKSAVGTQARSLQARQGDIVNVLDFSGVDPTGVADSTTGLQNAINSLGGTSGLYGTIFFPAGTYKLTAALTIAATGSNAVKFVGAGSQSTTITGTVADFLFKVTNTAAIGIITFEDMSITNLSTNTSSGGILFTNVDGGYVGKCRITACNGIDWEQGETCSIIACSFNCSGSNTTGSNGVIARGNVFMWGCEFSNFDTGVRMHGPNVCVYGGRFEVNKTGIMLGRDKANVDDQSSGSIISGLSMEANDTGIWSQDASACRIEALTIFGSNGSPAAGSLYGMRLDGFANGTVNAVALSSAGGAFTTAGISTNNCGGSTFQNVQSSTNGVGPAWSFTANAFMPQIINCNCPVPATVFANKPSTPNLGHTYYFSDSTVATFASTIAGSGANHVKGEWNGTNWIVVGVY